MLLIYISIFSSNEVSIMVEYFNRYRLADSFAAWSNPHPVVYPSRSFAPALRSLEKSPKADDEDFPHGRVHRRQNRLHLIRELVLDPVQ